MLTKINTPIVKYDQRLFYRTEYEVFNGRTGGYYNGPIYHRVDVRSNNLFVLREPNNVLCQLRMYRWMRKAWEHRDKTLDHKEKRKPGSFSECVLKDELCLQLFTDSPRVTKSRIGRMLRMVVPYETNFQRNRSPSTGGENLMFWRWCHYLEIVYGLEHLMVRWLPEISELSTQDEWDEEMRLIRDSRPEEDYDLVAEIQRREAERRDARPRRS